MPIEKSASLLSQELNNEQEELKIGESPSKSYHEVVVVVEDAEESPNKQQISQNHI